MQRAAKLLTKREIDKAAKKLDSFVPDNKQVKLSATFTFPRHIDALVFIARITVHAEVLQHHPDITFTYSKVKVVITTHDLKGLTKKDFELATRIEDLKR